MSLLGALTPLGKAAHKYWIRAVTAYTLAGSASAVVVGALLGWAGHLLRVDRVFGFAIPLTLLLAIRELGWVHFRLPERRRQTEKVWAHEFGFVMAAAMWGFHVGLGFTTYIGGGGFLVLALTALGTGNSGFAAILMLVYWWGRAASVWVMPAISHTQDAGDLITAILSSRAFYSRSEALALIWSAGILIIWRLQTGVAH